MNCTKKYLVWGIFFLNMSHVLPAEGHDYSETITFIAYDIEKIKGSFPQLADFSAEKNLDKGHFGIHYSYRTQNSKNGGGWASGVPNPDSDGIWFSIDIHDANSTAQVHTQPMSHEPMCMNDKRVSFLHLDGDRTKSPEVAIWKILRKYGAKECGR